MLSYQLTILSRIMLYLDPGTGSVVLQAILAALLGIGVTVRIFWKKIKALFGAEKPANIDLNEDPDDE